MATSERIRTVDGLRAIAIAMVLFSHATIVLRTRYYTHVGNEILSFFFLGHFGVILFFVISGFLITGILHVELTRTGSIRLRRFYFRRTLRIFPPCYIYVLALATLVSVGLIHISSINFAVAFSYTADYLLRAKGGGMYLAHLWSLAVEEQFYLLWPALLLLTRKRPLTVPLFVIVTCPLLRVLAWHRMHSVEFYSLDLVADSLATGAALALLRSRFHASSAYVQFLRSKWVALTACLGLLTGMLGNHPRLYNPLLYAALAPVVANLCSAIAIDWAVDVQWGKVRNWLLSPPVQAVGLWSYSLYLWQELFTISPLTSHISVWPRVVIGAAASFILAAISYYAVEQQSLRLRATLEHRLFARKESATAAVANQGA